MSDKPNYFAILTADVRYDKRLSSSEKLFYAEITALSNKNGYCHATNSYFAELYDVKRSTISSWVKKLTLTNHINVQMFRQGNVIVQRRIYLTNPPDIGGQKIGGVVRKSEGGWSENPKGGGQKTRKGIIQVTNTTSSNNYCSFEQFWDAYDKKIGKVKAERRWQNLTSATRKTILQFIPIYKASLSDKRYQKNPESFLNSRLWEDDWNQYKKNEKPTEHIGRTQYAYDRYQEIFGEDFPEE